MGTRQKAPPPGPIDLTRRLSNTGAGNEDRRRIRGRTPFVLRIRRSPSRTVDRCRSRPELSPARRHSRSPRVIRYRLREPSGRVDREFRDPNSAPERSSRYPPLLPEESTNNEKFNYFTINQCDCSMSY
ncbi:hypothetical protein PUN28_018498 [Cardiocondyla obscurior]|uniref:Uncharacterized protein n=1 Tax=Cardiocondyla obscurior TaxID=286306 RepID=A0AAW2EIJ8_9HYME